MPKGENLTKEIRDKGRVNMNIVKRANYVENVKDLFNDLLQKLLSPHVPDPANPSPEFNRELIEYVMNKYGIKEQSASEYVGRAKTLALINANTSEFAQKVLKKNYLRLEEIIDNAYEKNDTATQLKGVEMENKMFNIYARPTMVVENNTQEGTQKFIITLGNEQ